MISISEIYGEQPECKDCGENDICRLITQDDGTILCETCEENYE